MYHEYSQDELRSYCRQNIENLEIWARNFIHEKMTAAYGKDYINYKTSDEAYLIKKEIRDHVARMKAKEPQRYNRDVDTLFIDHIIYLLCHDKLYKSLFKEALDGVYPDGKEEVRTILTRLVPIRNNLSHSNPISMHQVERAICYSHDFIEGLKAYYKSKGKEKMWNVPNIIRIKDSLGNVFDKFKDKAICVVNVDQPMNVGDSYSLEIEVDPSFDKRDYRVVWQYGNQRLSNITNKHQFCITFTNGDVGESNCLICKIIQNKDWHKYRLWDFCVYIYFSVLPPKD